MKAYSDKLDDDLFDEIEYKADEYRNDDLVHCHLPGASGSISVQVVVYHNWKEANFRRY